ncbi:MAG: SAM-dependent chlorinase/fluorinase [Armatimonadota bacterium]|nr:SAM-dependent chlorinase/fluorinase [Armatimonadota bacterium]
MGIVTLLSDFGSASPYPAQMKAVLASSCDAALVDITHDVPRHDVRTGAYLLAAVAAATPAGTVHLAVVDPGVGTARQGLVVAAGGQLFVGPDNGLLIPAARRLGVMRVYALSLPQDRPVSATFHGRDVFAPAAARLARGAPPHALGTPTDRWVDLDLGAGSRRGRRLSGAVIYVDAFGNLITNIPSSLLPEMGAPLEVVVGRRRGRAVAAPAYGAAGRGALVVVPGSDGLLEVAVREGDAASRLQAAAGARVTITVGSGRHR